MTALSPLRAAPTVSADVLDALPLAVVAVTRDLAVTLVNAEAEQALAPKAPVLGRPLPEPWGALSLRALARAAAAGGARLQARSPVEGGRTVEVTAAPTDDGAVLVVRDVTAEEGDEAERAFAANASHELRGSLAGITAAVEALELGAKEEPRARDELLHGIGRELRLMRDEVEALLAMERAGAGRPLGRLGTGALAPLLEEVASGLTVGAGVRVRVACEPELSARATRPLLTVALRNVARNAAEHTVRGTIELSAYPRDRDVVVLEVADDGAGVPADLLGRVFERFTGGTDEGSGIGLALTRQIATRLGGEVELESDRSGTTVRILLPAA